jgi:ATP-dependent exoDNAse (exonuclease V) beta subunit
VFVRPASATGGAGAADALPEVWRERRFAVPAGEGELLRGAFDRVVLWRAADRGERRAVAAEITDFKSDAPPPDPARTEDWIAERVARYAPQMRDYRAALARLTGLPPAGIACRLLFLQVGAVRDVAADA